MAKTIFFKCRHCKQWCKKNYRIKGNQYYCGDRQCQQARKNLWESEKLRNDPSYRLKRKTSKKAWYKNYPGDQYQTNYREEHPDYVSDNREKQSTRNENRTKKSSASKIVKTDGLFSESLTGGGLYMIIPYESGRDKKVVKTDGLFFEIHSHNASPDFPLSRSP